MKLKNKKTGEVAEVTGIFNRNDKPDFVIDSYNSLAELNKEWEDYEEPKTFWYLDEMGVIKEFPSDMMDCKGIIDNYKKIGNYFETKEEAERAVEKLKAWKGLENKGFRFKTYSPINMNISYGLTIYDEESEEGLDTLFGGEE